MYYLIYLFIFPSWKSRGWLLSAWRKEYCALTSLIRIYLCGFAVFCRTQLVSLDWHHMWSCNIQLHSGRPSLSLGSVQKTLECEALPRGFEGAVPYGRKVRKPKLAAFLGRRTSN